MLIRRRRGWEIPEREATPEGVYLNRRQLMATAGAALGAALLPGAAAAQAAVPNIDLALADPTNDLYPVPLNPAFAEAGRSVTPEAANAVWNNFYEYLQQSGNVSAASRLLRTRPWTVRIDGLVEEPRTIDIDALIRMMPLEERIYRHRCVETWAMTIPWSGFPLKALVDFARPLGSATHIQMQTFLDPTMGPLQRLPSPWPYTDGLTMAEATNELAFMVTGTYGHPALHQHGAPLRLAVPWKYGFKSVKSIVRITFTDTQPLGYWEERQGFEYGFWANVNPDVSHPRWSQQTEALLGTESALGIRQRVPTQIYNGYGEWVAHLYAGMNLPETVLFR